MSHRALVVAGVNERDRRSGPRRAATAALLAGLVLMLLPAAAAACPTKPKLHHHGKRTAVTRTCVDYFKQLAPCPGAGQSVTQWADEGITKGATKITGTLTFPAGGCPHATVTDTFNPNATKNPDGSPTNPKRGEQVAQYVYTETGTGPGGQTPNVRVSVTYQDPAVKPLTIEKHALDKLSDKNPEDHTFTGVLLFYVIQVTNPGRLPAEVHVRDRLPSELVVYRHPHGEAGSKCRLDAGIMTCDDVIPARESRRFIVEGYFRQAGKWVNVASATGTSDGVSLGEVRDEWRLNIIRP